MNKKNIFKNQKGSLSILGAILIFTVVTVIGAYVSINKSSWINSELQSTIDLASLNALNNSIDKDKLRKEIFAVKGTFASADTTTNPIKVRRDSDNLNHVMSSNFQKELNKQIQKSEIIESISVKKCESVLEVTEWGINSSKSTKSKPQLSIDAVVQVIIKNNSAFDNLGSYNLNYKDAKTGTIQSVHVEGKTNDGKVVLTVRCLSRIVYR